MEGFIQVYTGKGKGKTTAALGLAIRAVGAGKKVFIGQFVKSKKYSEVWAILKFLPDITIRQYGNDCFIFRNPTEEDILAAEKGIVDVASEIISGLYDVVILDEATIAIYYHLISLEDLIHAIKLRPSHMEIIITGRNAPPQLIDMADLVTEMQEIKHYYTKGVAAREGIEF